MSGRFTLAGLLMGVTLVALLLAIVVPAVRYARRTETHADSVASVAASADGSTFAALMGDGRVMMWDKTGVFNGSLQTDAMFAAELALSFDGTLAAVCPGDVWEVSTRKVWRTLGSSAIASVFSPTEDRIAVVNHAASSQSPADEYQFIGQQEAPAPIYQVYTMTRNSQPRMICDGEAATFSPDGKWLAVAGYTRGGRAIDIFDAAEGGVERSLKASSCDKLAWAPGGQSLAGVYSSYTFRKPVGVSICTYDLLNGAARDAVVPRQQPTPGGPSHTLTYLPDGQHLLVGAPTRGFRAFKVRTLQEVANADLSKVWHVAAGVRGDTFVAAESHAVDLRDAATLRPRQRLFDAAPPPDHRLPAVGFVAWVVVFVLRRRGKAMRSVQPAARGWREDSHSSTPFASNHSTAARAPESAGLSSSARRYARSASRARDSRW